MQARLISEDSGIPLPRSSGHGPQRGGHLPARVRAAVLAAAMGSLCSFGSAAADCIEYGDYLHWVSSVHTPGPAAGVAISETHACVADGDSGLQVIDITNPESLQIVGSVDTPGEAWGVAVSGTYAYVAASGLQVLPTQCEESSGLTEDDGVAAGMLLQALPNPSSRQTAIRFEVRDGGLVRASVYDPAGQCARRLVDRILGAGMHDLAWDGRDDAGRAVEAGIYLIRVSTTRGTTTTRFVMVK